MNTNISKTDSVKLGVTTEFKGSGDEQECGKLKNHDVSSTDRTSIVKQSLEQAILANPMKVTRVALALGLKTVSINPFIKVLSKNKASDLKKIDQAAKQLFEIVTNKLQTADAVMLTKIEGMLNPSEKQECSAGNAKYDSEPQKPYQIDQHIAKVEVNDPQYLLAVSNCEHVHYNQKEGRITWHTVQQVKHDRHMTNHKSEPGIGHTQVKHDRHITSNPGIGHTHGVISCKDLEQIRRSMKSKGFIDRDYNLNSGDTITKTTLSVNTRYALKLFKVAQCIHGAITQAVDPNEFDFLSVKIRVQSDYPAVRMLNIQSTTDEHNNCRYQCDILDDTEHCLVSKVSGLGNIYDVIFADLQALTDFSENKQSFETLDAEGKIRVDVLSSCPSDKPLMNPELLVSNLKIILRDNQELFNCQSQVNRFAPTRLCSEMSLAERRDYTKTWRLRRSFSGATQANTKIERQTFWVDGDSLKEHPVHKLEKE